MKPEKFFVVLLILSLTACNTINVNSERTLAAPVTVPVAATNQTHPTTQLAPTAESSVPTALPTFTATPTQRAQTPTPLRPSSTQPVVSTATRPPASSLLVLTASPSNDSGHTGLSLDQLPAPAFFFKSKEGDIYYLDGIQRHRVNQETFLNLGYPASNIADGVWDGTQMSYPQGAPLTRLLKGSDDRVYWMEDGFRRHIPDMETFRQLGYRQEDIFQVADGRLMTWPLGEPLPSVLGTPPEAIPAPSQERVVLSYRPLDRYVRASELYTVYADGRNPRRLSYTKGDTYHDDPSWSPDSRSIAFAQCLSDFPAEGGCKIAATRSDRWDPQQLTKDGLLHDPAWSLDGTRLAFTNGYSLTVMPLADGDAQFIAVRGWYFAWTPDGHIAFWLQKGDNPAETSLMVMDADGQDRRTVKTQITVFDQRYFPWRQAEWGANGSPDHPTGQ